MKFTTLFAVLATVATAVTATFDISNVLGNAFNTNAKRFAHGMPPLPPAHGKPTPTHGHKSKPSAISNSCNSGPVQCCDSYTTANDSDDSIIKLIEGLVGVVVAPNVGVALTCSPITALGLGGNSCNTQTVCCDNNSFNGVVALGCNPVNL